MESVLRRLPTGIVLAGISLAALAAGPYDGNYHGTLRGAGFNAVGCAKEAPVQMTVADNKLTYVHLGNATITATVAADGSFSGSGQNNYAASRSRTNVQTLDGKITGDAITAVTKGTSE